MKIERDTVTLSTGREFPAHCGLVSVHEDGTIHTGYGDRISFVDDGTESEKPLTTEEREEIGAAMVQRWATWMGAVDVLVVMPGRIDKIEASIGFANRKPRQRQKGNVT